MAALLLAAIPTTWYTPTGPDNELIPNLPVNKLIIIIINPLNIVTNFSKEYLITSKNPLPSVILIVIP